MELVHHGETLVVGEDEVERPIEPLPARPRPRQPMGREPERRGQQG
jgi:hypothetical protein